MTEFVQTRCLEAAAEGCDERIRSLGDFGVKFTILTAPMVD
jgi:hypothetical protein